ncbi:unnamed protein product [Pedinophyceae sp. YPF-701]|nr:unnamed protein product [Pedinophyceae sp. YPF-701]
MVLGAGPLLDPDETDMYKLFDRAAGLDALDRVGAGGVDARHANKNKKRRGKRRTGRALAADAVASEGSADAPTAAVAPPAAPAPPRAAAAPVMEPPPRMRAPEPPTRPVEPRRDELEEEAEAVEAAAVVATPADGASVSPAPPAAPQPPKRPAPSRRDVEEADTVLAAEAAAAAALSLPLSAAPPSAAPAAPPQPPKRPAAPEPAATTRQDAAAPAPEPTRTAAAQAAPLARPSRPAPRPKDGEASWAPLREGRQADDLASMSLAHELCRSQTEVGMEVLKANGGGLVVRAGNDAGASFVGFVPVSRMAPNRLQSALGLANLHTRVAAEDGASARGGKPPSKGEARELWRGKMKGALQDMVGARMQGVVTEIDVGRGRVWLAEVGAETGTCKVTGGTCERPQRGTGGGGARAAGQGGRK